MPSITYTTTQVRAYEKGERLEGVLNKEAYELLVRNNYELAEAIEEEIAGGMSPDEIRNMARKLHYNTDIVQKCYQAALHLKSSG